MELESTFYVIGIVCMSLITLILVGLIVIALIIKAKVATIQRSLEARIRPLSKFVNKAEEAVENVAQKVNDATRKVSK